LTINNPPMNVLCSELLLKLKGAIEDIKADKTVKAVVLTGAGRAFVAGADIKEMMDLDSEKAHEFATLGQGVFNMIEDLPVPVIAAVNGFALGGGTELAMSCDIRIASEAAKFGQPEVSLGVIPGFGGTQRLPRLVGPGKAMELIFTGDIISSKAALEIGLARMDKFLARSVSKGRMTEEEKAAALSRVTGTTDIAGLKDCDIIIEAVIENLELKKKIFAQVDEICKEGAILASNTSTIPITEMAAGTAHPEKFIGMHFMNPVPIMKLVEIIRGLATSDETAEAVVELTKKLNKIPIEVNDFPGFVSNRILLPMINEAVYALMEGVATKESIDGVMKLGMNHPMGPLELADLIGLDTCLYIMQVLYDGFSDSKYRPCPLLRKMVNAGYLGRKSGQGFYDYRKK